MTNPPVVKPPEVTTETAIGWIGTGVMGRSMCGHLLTGGYRVTIYSRTRTKADSLLEQGGTWADSPAAVAAQSQVIFTMTGFSADVRKFYLGEDGVLAGARPAAILVDMTTTEPNLAQEIHGVAKSKGISAVDAPVAGGDVGARNATLSIMAGGDRSAVDAVMPLLELMGKQIVYQGGPGAGQHTKMCNQIVIAGTMIGVFECLLYGYKAGLDLEAMLRSVSSGAAACWSLSNLAPRVLGRESRR